MAESKSTKLYNFFDYIDDSRTIHDKFKRLHNGYSEPNEVRVYQSLDSKRCFVAVKSEVIFLGYKKPNFNFYSLALMSDIPKEGYNDAPLFNLHNEFDYKFGYGYDCLDVLARDEKDEKGTYHLYRYFDSEILPRHDGSNFHNDNLSTEILPYSVENLPRFINLQTTFINLIDQIKVGNFQLPKLIPQ